MSEQLVIQWWLEQDAFMPSENQIKAGLIVLEYWPQIKTEMFLYKFQIFCLKAPVIFDLLNMQLLL